MVGFTSFIQEVARTLDLDKSGYRIISNVGVDGGQSALLAFSYFRRCETALG